MDFLIEKDNSATTNSSVATISDDTFVTHHFITTQLADLHLPVAVRLKYLLMEVATQTTLTNATDDEDLTISFGIQNGAAAAKTMTVDYILAAVER